MKSASADAPAEPMRRLIPFRRAHERRAEELAFLPAALEIVETPPSPIGRAIAGTVALLFCAALAWAWWGTIDIVASATGKIVPSSRTKVIQPFETGVVRAIHVTDGQVVRAGDPLVELDTTINAAEGQRVAAELLPTQLEIARLRALLEGLGDPSDRLVAPPDASPAQITVQRSLLASQEAEHRAKLANIDRQIVQINAARDGAAAEVKKLDRAIPLLQQRVDALRQLYEKGWGQKLQYLQLSQDLVEHQEELEAQKARLAETAAAVSALQEQRRQAEAEFQRANWADLATAEQKAASLQAQLIQARQRQHLQTLTAPVDGVVQQLAVHTVGGVVTPAQPLLVVVPSDSRLEIQAMVSNGDIGFVHPGQNAEIKIDTFDFTRYGLLRGEVLSVSQDAISRDRDQDETNDRGPAMRNDGSEPKGQQLSYDARISLDRTRMRIDDQMVKLSPGMAVTVEIKTGSRRILSYFSSPLLRYRQETLRER